MIETNIALLWFLCLLNFVLLVLTIRRRQSVPFLPPPEIQALPVGASVPAFSTTTLSGEDVSEQTLFGKRNIIIFLAPNCGPCRLALPSYVSLFPKAAKAGWQMMLVSNGSESETRHLLEENKVQIPTIVATQGESELLDRFLVKQFPFYYETDTSGIISSAGFTGNTPSWLNIVRKW